MIYEHVQGVDFLNVENMNNNILCVSTHYLGGVLSYKSPMIQDISLHKSTAKQNIPILNLFPVQPYDKVQLYFDQLCSLVASEEVVAENEHVLISSHHLDDGEYRFYAKKISGNGLYSQCSTVHYTHSVSLPLSFGQSATIEFPNSMSKIGWMLI